jgi:hypothetical protein
VRGGFLLFRLRAGAGADDAGRSDLLAPCGIHRHSMDFDALGLDWLPALRIPKARSFFVGDSRDRVLPPNGPVIPDPAVDEVEKQ